jgi:hypothetical protein
VKRKVKKAKSSAAGSAENRAVSNAAWCVASVMTWAHRFVGSTRRAGVGCAIVAVLFWKSSGGVLLAMPLCTVRRSHSVHSGTIHVV